MSWLSNRRINSVKLTRVNMSGTVLGELTGFVSGDATLEYESELRRIASITTRDDNFYDYPYAMIRITIETNEGDSADLGTFCVQDAPKRTYSDESILTTYNLASVAYKAKTSQVVRNSVWQNSCKLWDVLGGSGCDDGIVHYSAEGGVESWYHSYGGDGYVISAGTSTLDIVSTICSDYGCRYDPADYNMKIKPYVNPKTQPSVFTFSDTNGTISGQIEVSDDRYSQINRAIVTLDSNDIKLVGWKDAGGSSGVSPQVREQIICQTWQENDLSPQTQDAVNQSAAQHLKDSILGNISFDFSGIYVGVREGDVVTLQVKDYVYKCIVQSMKLDLNSAMTCSYTLKAVRDD